MSDARPCRFRCPNLDNGARDRACRRTIEAYSPEEQSARVASDLTTRRPEPTRSRPPAGSRA